MESGTPLPISGDALESSMEAPAGYVVRDFNVCRSGFGQDGRGLSAVFLENLARASNYVALTRNSRSPLRIGHYSALPAVAGDGEGNQESSGYVHEWRTIPDLDLPGEVIVQATCCFREGTALAAGCMDGTYPMRSISYTPNPVHTRDNRLVGQVFDHVAFLGLDPANMTEDSNYSRQSGVGKALAGMMSAFASMRDKLDGLFNRASAQATPHAAQADTPDDTGANDMDPDLAKVLDTARLFLSEFAAKATEIAAMLPGSDMADVAANETAAPPVADDPEMAVATTHRAAPARVVSPAPVVRVNAELQAAEQWAVGKFRQAQAECFGKLLANGNLTEQHRPMFDQYLANYKGDPASALTDAETFFGVMRVQVPVGPALTGDGSPAQVEYHKAMELWRRMGDAPIPFEKWRTLTSGRSTAGAN